MVQSKLLHKPTWVPPVETGGDSPSQLDGLITFFFNSKDGHKCFWYMKKCYWTNSALSLKQSQHLPCKENNRDYGTLLSWRKRKEKWKNCRWTAFNIYELLLASAAPALHTEGTIPSGQLARRPRGLQTSPPSHITPTARPLHLTVQPGLLHASPRRSTQTLYLHALFILRNVNITSQSLSAKPLFAFCGSCKTRQTTRGLNDW